MKKIAAALLVSVLFASAAFAGGSGETKAAAKAPAKKWRIALCNDYAGNSWRQQMIKDWQSAVAVAKAKGIIAEGPVFNTNESSAAEQSALLQNLILEGYDAIVLDAASPTSLNGAVKKATDAGIPVISFDQAVTEASAYRLYTDFGWMGSSEVEFLAKKFQNANILEIRGMAGTFADTAIHDAVKKTIQKYPGLKIQGEVFGNWTQTVAQKEVAGILPSLPEIDAVIAQGGDGYGCIKAFEAAGRKVPLVIFGHRYDELVLWKEMKTKAGSYPTMSVSIAPGSCQVAFWTAIEVLSGKVVPKEINLLPLTIPEDKMEWFLSKTEKGGVATIDYPQDWVQKMIESVKAGKGIPADPLPN